MKNKIILSILILSVIALIFSGCDGGGFVTSPISDNEETSDYFQLDVPYIEQNSNNTCLPASGAMILKYYEDSRDIAEIRDKLALPWQADGTGGIMVSGHGYIAKLFDYVKSLGFTTKTEWDGLTIEEIKDKLEDGFPIIVLQDFYLDSNKEYDGHFSVIVGYRETGDNDEENKLIINDPWSSRGQYWEVTYSDFKIRNSNWWKEQHNRDSDLSHSYIIWKDASITPIIPASIIMEEFNGNTIGNSYGIVYTNTINGQGAVFSRVKESRIEYPFSIGFPHEGTIEYLIKVYHGYRYSDYVLNDNSDCARIFDTGSQDVWYPGAIWIDVCDNGTINLGTATAYAQPESHNLKATGTDFAFNEWHTIGISFGSQGQYIMLDGNIVA